MIRTTTTSFSSATLTLRGRSCLDRDKPLGLTSQKCSFFEKLMRAPQGFGADDIQGWLDLHWVVRNVGDDMRPGSLGARPDHALPSVGACYRNFFSGRVGAGA